MQSIVQLFACSALVVSAGLMQPPAGGAPPGQPATGRLVDVAASQPTQEGVPTSVLCRGAPPTSAPSNSAGQQAHAAFEKIKSLAGEWNSKSTRGWTEKESYQVISGGSVVMHLSYGAHPGEWMATMFHMDGDRLLLTHYCIAGNQPRLRATEISDDLSRITFTLLDATNLPSRDTGHMDKHVMVFEPSGQLRTRWTWFANGQERWMEEIEHRRVTPPAGEKSPGSEPQKAGNAPRAGDGPQSGSAPSAGTAPNGGDGPR
ncbi:MAG: hypothetical protein U1A27_14880 [Phycisphaerae bacterium]